MSGPRFVQVTCDDRLYRLNEHQWQTFNRAVMDGKTPMSALNKAGVLALCNCYDVTNWTKQRAHPHANRDQK